MSKPINFIFIALIMILIIFFSHSLNLAHEDIYRLEEEILTLQEDIALLDSRGTDIQYDLANCVTSHQLAEAYKQITKLQEDFDYTLASVKQWNELWRNLFK